MTRLLPILSAGLKRPGVRVVIYIGDVFEESVTQGRRLADAMGAQNTSITRRLARRARDRTLTRWVASKKTFRISRAGLP